jgi:hypothetical protein
MGAGLAGQCLRLKLEDFATANQSQDDEGRICQASTGASIASQLHAMTQASPALSEWLTAYDKASVADEQDPMEALH